MRKDDGRRKTEDGSRETEAKSPMIAVSLPERAAVEGREEVSSLKGAADQNLTLDLFQESEVRSPKSEAKSPIIESPLPERAAVEGSSTYQPNIYQQFEEMDDPENEL
ncbi:MAG: hypothetical protein Q7J19_11520, partial [Lutibacter sp.]|nr:hypothetical protein [Lutibacter sp.]